MLRECLGRQTGFAVGVPPASNFSADQLGGSGSTSTTPLVGGRR